MYSSEKKFGEYAIISISFWYVVTFLYTNVGYRLPSFFLLFLLLFITNGNKIKSLIIGLMFLEPVIWHSEAFVRNIFLTINNVCHYIIFLICLKFLFSYSIEQIKKLFNDVSNKKILYQNTQRRYFLNLQCLSNSNGLLEFNGNGGGMFSYTQCKMHTKVGDLLIFPYDLRHGVYPFRGTTQCRRTISYNCDLTKLP